MRFVDLIPAQDRLLMIGVVLVAAEAAPVEVLNNINGDLVTL